MTRNEINGFSWQTTWLQCTICAQAHNDTHHFICLCLTNVYNYASVHGLVCLCRKSAGYLVRANPCPVSIFIFIDPGQQSYHTFFDGYLLHQIWGNSARSGVIQQGEWC